MDNYLSKLMQFSPKALDLEYNPKTLSKQDNNGGYYPSQEQEMFYQSPITFEGEGGVDKYGKYIGGTVSGYIPFRNGSFSGRVSGNVNNYGKTTGQLSGAGLNYNYGPHTIGGDYGIDPETGGRNYLARYIFNY